MNFLTYRFLKKYPSIHYYLTLFINSTRLWTPSFLKSFLLCVETVAGEINNSSAICLSLFPSEISRAICCSRDDSDAALKRTCWVAVRDTVCPFCLFTTGCSLYTSAASLSDGCLTWTIVLILESIS